MEKYYYCTKKIKFLIKDVVNETYKYFSDKNATVLPLNELYAFLSLKFNVKSFNRANLSTLLSSKEFVNLETVKELSVKYNDLEVKKTDSDYSVLEKLFINERENMLKIVSVLGVESIYYILKHGIDNFAIIVSAFNGDETISTNYGKILCNDISSKTIREFLKNIIKEDLIKALQSDESIKLFIADYINSLRIRDEKNNFVKIIKVYADDIHVDNLNARLLYLLPFNIYEILSKHHIELVRDLKNFGMVAAGKLLNYKDTLIEFVKNLKYSLPEKMNDSFSKILKLTNKNNKPNSLWEKYVEILENRAKGMTLEAASEDCTRERVRQLENKYLLSFKEFYCSICSKDLNMIRAFAEDIKFLNDVDIIKLFPFNPLLFKYLLSNIVVDGIEYVEELKRLCYIDDYYWYEELKEYSETMPERFFEDEFNIYYNNISNQISNNGILLSKEDYEKVLLFDYKKIGNTYSKSNMNLSQRFRQIWQQYYKDPIDINDVEFLKEFRKKYENIYHINLDQTDHATETILQRIGLLRDRGMYVVKDRYFMSEALAEKIYDYILNSGRKGFITNNLFSVFQEELLKENIDNKYFMQGALKQRLEGRLFFRRDYICTSPGDFNIYADVVKYIQEEGRIVGYDELKETFQGVTDIVLNIALSQESILWYRKKFIHVDSLNLTDSDKAVFYDLLLQSSRDGKIHHIEEIFEYLKLTNNDLLEKYKTTEHFALFSLLQYCFNDKFEFKRPFFAQNGVVIGNESERIKEFVYSQDELLIEDLLNFVYENRMHIYSIIECIDSFEDYIFKDSESIVSIDKLGIDKYTASFAEKIISRELGSSDFIFAEKLSCINALPNNIKWTPWLIYSVLKKYGSELKTIPSNNQFKFKNTVIAKPIIIRRDTGVNNIDELKTFLQEKYKMEETKFYFYLKSKGLA